VGEALVAERAEVAVLEIGEGMAVAISTDVAEGALLALGQVDEVH
jgi:hypothetical protein